MKARETAHTRTVTLDDLTAKVRRGNFGPYTYTTPNYYTRRGYRYHAVVYVYLAGHEVDRHALARGTRREILDYLAQFKQSHKYARLTR